MFGVWHRAAVQCGTTGRCLATGAGSAAMAALAVVAVRTQMKSVWFPLAAAPRGSDHDSFFILFYFRSVPIMTVGVFLFFFFQIV